MKKIFFLKNNKINTGYTIIETMIAVSLFLVVVMIGMGALLNANLLHQKSRDMRSILDNLSFVMEDMGKNLRTGYNYRCYDNGLPWVQSYAQNNNGSNNNTSNDLNTPRSCASGGVIVFEEAYGHTSSTVPADPNATDQWVYKIESTDSGVTFDISKSIDGGLNWVQLNSDEVVLDSVSGFSVMGAESPPDVQQPFVTIRLVGTITFKNVVTPFSFQTSVSQRVIDI
ncbi:MAG: hypothetical protein AAB595_01825 [Patescibacteria group bacterium]